MAVITREALPRGTRVAAPDAQALSDWLRGVILRASRGPARWDAVIDGDAESVRYAVDSTGLADGESRPSQRHVVATVDANTAVALHDAWTPSLSLVLSATIDGRTLVITRNSAEQADIESEQGLPNELAAVLTKLPVAQPAPVEAMRAQQPAVPRRRRRRVIPVLAAAVIPVAAVVAVVVWTLLHRSAGAAPAAAVPTVASLPTISGSAVASDPRDGSILLVGCCDGDGRVAGWTWAAGRWSHVPASTPAPPFNRGVALAFDGAVNEFVLQGGVGSDATWTWNGLRWRQAHPAHQPSAGPGIAVFDEAAHVLVFLNQTVSSSLDPAVWTWNGSDWTAVPTTPVLLGPTALAYDPVRARAVLLDEVSRQAQTWTFDGAAWSQPDTPQAPQWDPSTRLAWDAQSGRMVAMLLGDTAIPARGLVVPADTWTWDGARWLHASSDHAPARTGRLLSWLGSAVFVADGAGGTSRPDFFVWTGGGWELHAGGAGLAAHSGVADRNVLADAGITLQPAIVAPTEDYDRAVSIATSAAFPSLAGYEHARLLSISEGVVRSASQVVCECVTVAVLRTTLPSCPGLETVQQEAVVLVDIHSGGVVRILRPSLPPGTVFGRCG